MKSFSGQGRMFDGFLVLFGLIGVAVLVLSIVSVSRSDATAAGPGVAAAGVEEYVGHVTLTEFAIDGDLELPLGDIGLNIRNAGAVEHNLVVESLGRTADLGSGVSASLDLGVLGAGRYDVFCDIPGHRDSGMEAVLVVREGAEPPMAGGHGDGETDWAALDAAMMNSILAFPAATEGKGNQILEPTILADGTKEFHLTTAITPWEVEPGKIVDAWTYNGQVPGPSINIDVGDKIRVVVDNQLPMGTDIHWHGVRTPNDQDGVAPLTQPLIESGTQYVYEFVAEKAAIGMYHAHHHGQMQIPNGLFGTFTIGELPIPYGQTISGVTIPEDLEVALEIPMVLNDAGVIGYSLNGKSFPATEPYVVNQGDWVAVTYYNEGLQIHPMHQHQFPQLVFAKDGIALDQPYWADTINVAPGERYSILLQADSLGAWVWHCHILTHVERDEGMFGMVTAIIVQ